MQRVTLNAADGTGFEPRCVYALANYGGPVFNQESLPHPSGIISHSWNEVLSSFNRTFDALDGMNGSVGLNDRLIENLLSAFKEVLYHSTEFFDDLSGNVAETLRPKERKTLAIGGSKALRSVVAHPCNKLKHEHNRLDYNEANSGIFKVRGFTIYHAVNGVLKPNPELHEKQPARSFNLELRKIFAAIYFYSDVAAAQISELHPPQEPFKKIKNNPRTIEVIRRLTTLPVFTFPFENSRDMPSIVYDGAVLAIAERGGNAFPLPKNVRMTARYRNDGTTLAVKPPGMSN